MSALHQLLVIVTEFVEFAFRRSARIWPVHLGAMVIISAAVWWRSVRGTSGPSFWRWLVPKPTYLHPSHRTDLKLFFAGQALVAVGLLGAVTITTGVATTVAPVADRVLPDVTGLGLVAMTLVLVVASDFTTYWVHRGHHEARVLWPFHSVHHSAEVMTPITLNRKHPIYDVFSTLAKGLVVGSVQGLLLAVFVDEVAVSTIAGVNAGYFLFNLLGANLRHSHVWLGYGSRLEHLLISPAQHQIHHSIRPEHFNKNYGEIFAIWDWMFGTLHLSGERQELRFGLSDGTGRPVAQPHPTFRKALWVPIAEAASVLTEPFGARERRTGSTETSEAVAP